MYTLEIFYIGGSSTTLVSLTDEDVDRFYKWLDNDNETGTFSVIFTKKDKKANIRKQVITSTILTSHKEGVVK